ATAELLETLGVPVLGWRTPTLPLFYSVDGGPPGAALVTTSDAGAALARPPEPALDIEPILAEAVSRVRDQGVTGQLVTPSVLALVHELSGGRSIEVNRQLIADNAALAAEVAVAYARVLLPAGWASPPGPRLPWPDADRQPERGRPGCGRSGCGRSGCGRSVLGRPVLGRPVLGRPVLGRPVLGRPVLGRPVRGDRAAAARGRHAGPCGGREGVPEEQHGVRRRHAAGDPVNRQRRDPRALAVPRGRPGAGRGAVEPAAVRVPGGRVDSAHQARWRAAGR